MGVVDWFRSERAQRKARRAVGDDGVLFKVAEEQAERLGKDRAQAGDGRDDAGQRLFQHEVLLTSGVVHARNAAVRPYMRALDGLAEGHRRQVDAAGMAVAQVGLLEARENVVTVREPGRFRREDVFADSPDLAGDAHPLPALREEHDRLVEQIKSDTERGETRHRAGLARWMKLATFFLVFVDVAAMAMILIPAENTTIDPAAYQGEGLMTNLPRLITALALALLVAAATTVIAHWVGGRTWKVINTPRPADADEDAETTEVEDAPPAGRLRAAGARVWAVAMCHPVLAAGWVAVLGLAGATGLTMTARLGHSVAQAAGNIGPLAGALVAFLVGIAATLAPVAVAFVTAEEPSPEVLRRNALAKVIAGIDRQIEAQHQAYTAATLGMAGVVEQACRRYLDAEEADREANLPAAQSIQMLRTKYGYAGEFYTALQVARRVEDTGDGAVDTEREQDPVEQVRARIVAGAPLFDSEPLARARAVIDQMVARTVPDLEAKTAHTPTTTSTGDGDDIGNDTAGADAATGAADAVAGVPDQDAQDEDGDDLRERVIHAV